MPCNCSLSLYTERWKIFFFVFVINRLFSATYYTSKMKNLHFFYYCVLYLPILISFLFCNIEIPFNFLCSGFIYMFTVQLWLNYFIFVCLKEVKKIPILLHVAHRIFFILYTLTALLLPKNFHYFNFRRMSSRTNGNFQPT